MPLPPQLTISGTSDFIIKDEELIGLQVAFAKATNPAVKKRIVDEINAKRFQKVTSLSLGQFFPIMPSTVDLKNFVTRVLPFYANTWLER